MTKSIILTGGFGFIGSSLVEYLNKQGISPHIIENQDNVGEKWRNFMGLRFTLLDSIYDINKVDGPVSIVHLGANVDTREKMNRQLWRNNLTFTTDLFGAAQEYQVVDKFIYASSGAVYGNEENDFSERIRGLKPTNAYAATKLLVDNHFFGTGKKWESPRVYGLRFFNVYGSGREQAKGDMASLVYKGLNRLTPLYNTGDQINPLSGGVIGHPLPPTGPNPKGPHWSLFKSHRPDIKDGEQKRDFIHVEDICKGIYHFLTTDAPSGIYNLGSGTARTFNDLIKAIDPNLPIEYVEMPEVLRPQYQYRTCADLTKLREVAGYKEPFLTLEEGIEKTREWLKTNG